MASILLLQSKFRLYALATIFFSLVVVSCKPTLNRTENLDFEDLDSYKRPIGWSIVTREDDAGATITVDSLIRHHGEKSICIRNAQPSERGTVYFRKIPSLIQGTKLRLSGFVKSENITGGKGGLFVRVEDESGNLVNNSNMNLTAIAGNNDWKAISVDVDYNPKLAYKVSFGAILTGGGKLWVDDLELKMDDEPYHSFKTRHVYKAETDTNFKNASKISQIKLTDSTIGRLANLGMIWSFIKYYHPAVASGNYQLDAELFRVLPKLLEARSDAEFYDILEQWVKSFGPASKCRKCPEVVEKSIKVKADYGSLFLQGNLPNSLIKKLVDIRDNYTNRGDHYYIKLTEIGNPIFRNEMAYSDSTFPDAGLRLLSLYSYWAKIQYFFPYRYLIGNNWNHALTGFIPEFVNAKNKSEYALACLHLTSAINDTHAYLTGNTPLLDSLKGIYISPVKAEFIQNKLVVTGFYSSSTQGEETLRIGSIIESINGQPVEELVKKYYPLTNASNHETKLRIMTSPYGFLLRSNKPITSFSIGNKKFEIGNIKLDSAYAELKREKAQKKAFFMLEKNIGYIYPARLNSNDLGNIIANFNHTKGLIIDLRCYPSTFMPFAYAKWLKPEITPFVIFTQSNLKKPGSFVYGSTIANGESVKGTELKVINGKAKISSKSEQMYKGKLLILVNSSTLSQAEYTTMALSTVPGAVVLGSTTAGADGDVSYIKLAGGYSTRISGLGIYYPDSTETQRVGIKIDVFKSPTIKGIQNGKDELLEEAIKVIEEIH